MSFQADKSQLENEFAVLKQQTIQTNEDGMIQCNEDFMTSS